MHKFHDHSYLDRDLDILMNAFSYRDVVIKGLRTDRITFAENFTALSVPQEIEDGVQKLYNQISVGEDLQNMPELLPTQ